MRFLVSEKLGPHRYKTPEGYLVCVDAILSRTGAQDYMRCELFGDACDEPDKTISVNRTDDEVFSDKAMASFENKAICVEHPDVNVNVENHNDLSVGFVRDIHRGEDDGTPVMMGTLVITDKDAVNAVESGEYLDLSCGYDCDIDDEGSPQQRNIRGNHVALCKQGRAGIARIVDSTSDVEFKHLNNAAKELKAQLNMYSRSIGSHKSTGKIPFASRRVDEQVKELNESINEAIKYLEQGVKDKSAWARLASKIEGWKLDDENKQLASKAAAAIRKFEKYVNDNIKDERSYNMNDVYTLGNVKVLRPGTQEYKNLQFIAKQFGAEVKDVYFDAGQDWKWTTVVKGDAQLLTPKQWLDVVNATSERELQKFITHNHDSIEDADEYTFKLMKKQNDYDEYVVRAFKNGKYNEDATYYTDDWDDAVMTLKAMAKQRGLNVKQQGNAFIADSKFEDTIIKTNDSLFTIEYVKNGITYITNVRAKSMKDAIMQVKAQVKNSPEEMF